MIRVSCPICERPLPEGDPHQWPFFPFCSERCRLIDLGRWLGEAYRIPPEASAPASAASSEDGETP
jgi:endogenous inhibitor of DNA gyrase (YacG/DUF329 family)